LRIIRLGFLWILGLVILAAVAVVLVNAFDEPLKEETRALRFPPAMAAVPAEQNLYLALLGQEAPHGESPIDFGQTRVDLYEAKLPALLEDPTISIVPPERNDAPTLTFRGEVNFLPPSSQASIWISVEDHLDELAQVLAANRELFDRYRALHALTGYQEIATPSPYQPFGYPSSRVRKLYLGWIAQRLKSGNVSEQKAALDDLAADLTTWRIMSFGTGSLVPKTLAFVYIQADTLLLADMLADRSIKIEPLVPQLDRITTPAELVDWRLGDALPGEFRMFQTAVDHADSHPLRTLDALKRFNSIDESKPFEYHALFWEPVLRYFYKKNATDNLRAEDALKGIAFASLKPSDFLAARDEYSKWREQHMNFLNFRILDNPMGKLLLSEMTFSAEVYGLRGYEVAATQRLLRLTYEIRRQRIPLNQIPNFIAAHPEWASHPVSGKPYTFNPDTNSISFTPVSGGVKSWRFSAPVWSGA